MKYILITKALFVVQVDTNINTVSMLIRLRKVLFVVSQVDQLQQSLNVDKIENFQFFNLKYILITKVVVAVSQVDQLQIVQSEIALLFNELETLRRQKHVVEEERAENDKQRDKEVFLLILTLKKFLTKSKHFFIIRMRESYTNPSETKQIE